MTPLGGVATVALALFVSVGCPQTIRVGGEVMPANPSVVAPAAEVVLDADTRLPDAETLQLTDAVLANLTSLDLTNIAFFGFGDSPVRKRSGDSSNSCKIFPGDKEWPSDLLWEVLDLLSNGALIKTVPIGAVCYQNNAHYDAVKCKDLLDHWTESEPHANDPSSVMSPLYQGETCMPQNGATGNCTLGGFPSYVINATSVYQIQLAINLARNLNIRLVVRNTGHDFLGKSTGAGALSIWTHHLKDVKFVENYESSSYNGPALKLGAGIEVADLYKAADRYGVTGVGGECKGVGVTGGYIAGGGHSPLSSKYGLGSDQVLSVDIVLPSGRFVTVDEKNDPDLFWAIRGGGGGTFGIVTGMTVKVYPKMTFSGVTWTIASGNGTNSDDVLWSAMEAYWRKFDHYAEEGSYGYSSLFGLGPGAGYTWTMHPWLVPGMVLADFKAMVAPLLDEWKAIGLAFEPVYFEHDNFYDTWSTPGHFPVETVANSGLRTASRLFPRANWESEEKLNATIAAVRSVIEDGSALILYNINGAATKGTPDSAANPAWRDAVMYAIIGSAWGPGAQIEEVEAVSKKVTFDWMERLRVVSPGSGGYLNEGDIMEPNFQQAFYGENYARLLKIKKEVDPSGLFWAPTAVGSEDWYVADQEEWLTLQTGRLCRK